MFPAEIVVVFSNLLSNAVKAASPNGRVTADGLVAETKHVVVTISNTGVAVPKVEGERWFRPFESTTTQADPVLGQGMGLGLPITRALLEEYSSTIAFVEPPQGYSTSVQVSFSPDFPAKK
jgi:signal transduction histidine kinase